LKQYSMRIGQANYSTYNGRTTYVWLCHGGTWSRPGYGHSV
jgi:hypothetical protein